MHLSRVFIRNYRSIRELDLRFCAGKNVIVGRNNSGKSNILSAINLVLGENSPDFKKSENVTESDFYTKKTRGTSGDTTIEISDEIFIWCELSREAGTELDFIELNKCYGFNVYSTGRRSPTRNFLKLEPLASTYAKIFEVSEDVEAKTYLNPKLKNQSDFETEFTDKYRFAFAFRAKRTETGVEKEIRFLYRTGDSNGWALAFKAYVRNALLQSAIIPSFRDPQNQLRISSWSWYGKLLLHLTEGSANLPKVQDALKNLQSAANDVFSTAQHKISKASLSVAFPGTELSFQFAADKREDLYKGCVIYIDDGFKSLLTEKGSGIQSATIIGLFNYYTREVNIKGSALLGIEEPELYLHPHARRVVSERLDEFLDGRRNQVILTTHSVDFLRLGHSDVNIILVKKGTRGETTAQSVSLRTFQALLRDNNQNELFFADKVIVCEGFDEYLIKAASRELFPKKLDEANVSVIAVNGKDNIAPLVGLILQLGIECYIFADFDFLLRDKSEERQKYNANAHSSLAELPLAFFQQEKLFGSKGKDIQTAIARLRAKIRNYDPAAFYQAKHVSEVPVKGVKQVVLALRSAGIGLLDGELESLSKETSFLSTANKLSLDKIYRIRGRLIARDKLSSFIELEQLRCFLTPVFAESVNTQANFESVQRACTKVQ